MSMATEEHKKPASEQIQSRVDELMRMEEEGASLQEMADKVFEELK